MNASAERSLPHDSPKDLAGANPTQYFRSAREPWTVASFTAAVKAAGLPISPLGNIPPATLAALLLVSLKTLERWRAAGLGPPPLRFKGLRGRPWYAVVDVVKHLNSGTY